ncbi:FadR family transcriptional regulator [Pikeienuella piscinae]|uniref:FadR family transcriptional regulator n=1 Tax=Pikeienuella piscinae TaxID=2748098 RepID=A0A7M3T6J6_9RHOB|nr:FCD domain-containing protein [Pikeienuella piscinae]QIE57627.1 FadR family transcriptional regulator [Pikeienuella piscinae]
MARQDRTSVLVALRSALDRLAPSVGDRLPDERRLAKALGCSRETLRTALTVLESENLIWRHVGQGTFRGARPAAAPLRDHLAIAASTAAELMRARYLIEPAIAGEAARRATAADIAHLRAAVRLCRAGVDSFACENADNRFHSSIAKVAGNPVLLTVLTYLSDTRRRSSWQREWDRTYRRIGVAEFKGGHSDEHARIVDAIENRDESGAGAAMRTHLLGISRLIGRAEA